MARDGFCGPIITKEDAKMDRFLEWQLYVQSFQQLASFGVWAFKEEILLGFIQFWVVKLTCVILNLVEIASPVKAASNICGIQ